MRAWPDPASLAQRLPLPPGVTLRHFTPAERDQLPEQLCAWYPAVRVGAESVFLDRAWLRARCTADDQPDAPVLALCVAAAGDPVGLLSFEAQPHAATLHARLGVLAPSHRSGLLGFLGFQAFELLGELTEAELLLVWVTLQSRGQQRFAARRGFRLCGIVPGFDRDARADGSSRRVPEALFAKLRVAADQVERPAADQLDPHTAALLALIWPEAG
jgi:hypothetical protein